MKQNITPCLWLDGNAKEAAELYTSVFPGSAIKNISYFGKEGFETHKQEVGKVLTVNFTLHSQPFTSLNGGPMYKLNPSVSLYVACEKVGDVDFLYNKLADGGMVMMPLDRYAWSERYAWISDRFGVSWQIALDVITSQKITPAFLFMGNHHPQSDKAIEFYTSVFPGSAIGSILRYAGGGSEQEGSVQHGHFSLSGNGFMIMGKSMQHVFDFTEAFSFQVFCDSQEEIDYFWERLCEGGSEQRCGWLKDRFGLSWQIIPSVLEELLSDPSRAGKVMEAFLKMKKFILADLYQ